MTNLIEMLDKFSSANSVPSVLDKSASEPLSADELGETLEHLELQTEHAQAMAEGSPNIFLKATMNIAALDFFTVLNRFDTVTLSKRLEEKPELYFQLMHCQFNLMKAHLEQQKFEFKQQQAEAKQREREQKLRARKPILLTGATLGAFNRTLDCSHRHHEADAPVQNLPASTIQPPASNTANTGVSRLVEFDASEHARPESHPSDDPNFHYDSWQDRVDEHSNEFACSPA